MIYPSILTHEFNYRHFSKKPQLSYDTGQNGCPYRSPIGLINLKNSGKF